MINWESPFDVNMLLAITFLISARPKQDLSSSWMAVNIWNKHEYDKERTKYLESIGYKVIRFWNNDVMKDIDSVIRAIIQAMESEDHL